MSRFSSGKPDANQGEIVAALRAVGASVTIISKVGSGCPDLLVGFRGRVFLLEVKTPEEYATKRNGLTLKEAGWHREWRGGHLYIVESVEAALAAIDAGGYAV